MTELEYLYDVTGICVRGVGSGRIVVSFMVPGQSIVDGPCSGIYFGHNLHRMYYV